MGCDHSPYFSISLVFCDRCGEPLDWRDNGWVIHRPELKLEIMRKLIESGIVEVVEGESDDAELGRRVREIFGGK